MRDHHKLKVFQLADALALLVYQHTKNFPPDEKYGLTSQIRRAAVSIAANIVEGAARLGEAEYIRFLGIAYASTRELEYELTIAARLGYLGKPSAIELQDLASQTGRALRALIAAIQKRPARRTSPLASA